MVDGKSVEAKLAVPRRSQKREGVPTERQFQQPVYSEPHSSLPSNLSRRKLFVGGLSKDVTDEDLKRHFEQYGAITSAHVVIDRVTHVHRGFGFVTFENAHSIDRLLTFTHELNGRVVDLRR